jgi:hypothetical protein
MTRVDMKRPGDADKSEFGMTEADTPMVACVQMLLLRDPLNLSW